MLQMPQEEKAITLGRKKNIEITTTFTFPRIKDPNTWGEKIDTLFYSLNYNFVSVPKRQHIGDRIDLGPPLRQIVPRSIHPGNNRPPHLFIALIQSPVERQHTRRGPWHAVKKAGRKKQQNCSPPFAHGGTARGAILD